MCEGEASVKSGCACSARGQNWCSGKVVLSFVAKIAVEISNSQHCGAEAWPAVSRSPFVIASLRTEVFEIHRYVHFDFLIYPRSSESKQDFQMHNHNADLAIQFHRKKLKKKTTTYVSYCSKKITKTKNSTVHLQCGLLLGLLESRMTHVASCSALEKRLQKSSSKIIVEPETTIKNRRD